MTKLSNLATKANIGETCLINPNIFFQGMIAVMTDQRNMEEFLSYKLSQQLGLPCCFFKVLFSRITRATWLKPWWTLCQCMLPTHAVTLTPWLIGNTSSVSGLGHQTQHTQALRQAWVVLIASSLTIMSLQKNVYLLLHKRGGQRACLLAVAHLPCWLVTSYSTLLWSILFPKRNFFAIHTISPIW